MRIVTLIENTAPHGLAEEWGLSLYIEYRGKKYLLDSGETGRYIENAKALGIDIAQIDSAILSHAHYDHAGGMETFFAANGKAHYYVRQGTGENCYLKYLFASKYIGLAEGILARRKDRITFVAGDFKLDEGVYLIPHRTQDLEAIGKRSHLYIKRDGRLLPDDFAHEQSLVFETEKGLILLNSCSHGGVCNIVNEARSIFPDKPVYAMIGGFHLFGKKKRELFKIAQDIKAANIPLLYTGHCTGKKAFDILHAVLGDSVKSLTTGTEITF